MTLTLTRPQRRTFQAATRVLTSPLDFDSDIDWRRAALKPIKQLLGADKATFVLLGTEQPTFSDDFDADATAVYLNVLDPMLEAFLAKRSAALPAVFDRARFWGSHLEDYFQSTYYNDYIRPLRAFDAVGLRVAASGAAAKDAMGHHLMCHHDCPHPDGFGDKALALLDLLHPAFEAGLRAWHDLALRRRVLCTALDRSGVRLGIYTSDGERLHQTPLLTEVLTADPERERVLVASREVARTVAGERLRSSLRFTAVSAPHAAPSRTVETAVAAYRLTGSLAPRSIAGPEPAVLVVVDVVAHRALNNTARASRLPRLQDLRDRFGFTKRQAEVALLLAGRHTNREVAETLHISPHTARHHTQAVLDLLEISSRRDVAGRLNDV
jgi:DNA-binding CsgD family transcriptional regulator